MLIDRYILQPNIDALLVFTLFLCIIITIRSIYLRKKKCAQELELEAAISALAIAEKELSKLRRFDTGPNDFESNLNNAGLTTELQKSRLAFSHKNVNCQPPERYQYIHSLTEKGISSSDIASILSISVQEAQQLVALASLAQKQVTTQQHIPVGHQPEIQ